MSSLTRLGIRIWNGTICVVIQTDQLQLPISISRNSYLGLYYPIIDAFFTTFDSSDPKLSAKSPLWLEYNGIAVHWNIPVGVLYDSLHDTSLDNAVWSLSVHRRGCPDPNIIPFIYHDEFGVTDYTRLVNEVVVNELKQSCFVLNGLARPMMNLSEPDSRLLWSSIVTLDRFEYTRIIRKVLLGTRRYPIKVIGPNSTRMILAPMAPLNEDGSPTTLGDMVLRFDLNQELDHMVQGVRVPKRMYLDTLWSTFRHLDNFLYVVLKTPKAAATNIMDEDTTLMREIQQNA